MEQDRVLIDKIDIVFRLAHKALFGQQLVVVGSHPLLGKWVVGSAGRMTWQQGDVWTSRVQFEAVEILTKPLEFKYVLVKDGDNANAEWESIPNRVLHVSLAYPQAPIDQWNKPTIHDAARLARLADQKKAWLAQAEKLRLVREADLDKNAPVANKPHILEEAAKLLELKQLDEDWAVVLGPKTVKVRWQFTDMSGEEIRLQCPFKRRTSVSLAEAKKAIIDGTSAKYGPQRIKKIEVRIEKAGPVKASWREVTKDEERFRLPLIFPGPLLKSTHATLFRVEFESVPKVLHERGKYLGYLEG